MTDPHSEPPLILWRLPASAEAVSEALAGLAPLLPLEAASEDLRLVLAEVLNNIVEHAYAGLPGRPIDVCVRAGPDGLRVETRDAGHRLPDRLLRPDETPMPDCAGPCHLLPEGGWGWAMIHRLARDVRYERRGNRNLFRFSIPACKGRAAMAG